jgi:CRISPR-associated protein Cas6/Cse3/CasE subtype I-E
VRQVTFPTLEADAYVLHQQIERLMGGRGANHYIWCAEPAGGRMLAVTIRSAALPEALDTRATIVPEVFRVGEEHPFNLVAQCAVRRGGRNVRTAIDPADDERRFEWLRRRAELNGFSVLAVEIASVERIVIGKSGARHLADRTRFAGHLRVIDAARFSAAMRNGIGHGKAFGLGLIDIG